MLLKNCSIQWQTEIFYIFDNLGHFFDQHPKLLTISCSTFDLFSHKLADHYFFSTLMEVANFSSLSVDDALKFHLFSKRFSQNATVPLFQTFADLLRIPVFVALWCNNGFCSQPFVNCWSSPQKVSIFYEMSRIQQFRITENIQQHFDVGSLVVIIILDFSYSCFRKQSRLTYKD